MDASLAVSYTHLRQHHRKLVVGIESKEKILFVEIVLVGMVLYEKG